MIFAHSTTNSIWIPISIFNRKCFVFLPWICPRAGPLSRHTKSDGNLELPVCKSFSWRMQFQVHLVHKTPESSYGWVSVCLQYSTKGLWTHKCSDSILELAQIAALWRTFLEFSVENKACRLVIPFSLTGQFWPNLLETWRSQNYHGPMLLRIVSWGVVWTAYWRYDFLAKEYGFSFLLH